MTEKNFNEILNGILKEKGYSEFPCVFYNNDGDEDSIFYIKFISTHIVNGKEVVAFAEIYGDISDGYYREDNAHVEKHICAIDVLESYLRKRLETLKASGVVDAVDKGIVVSDSMDVIIHNINKISLNIPAEIMLLITNIVAESFEKGEKATLEKLTRTEVFSKTKTDTIDFSKYLI
jgi:hypothetical protein